MNFQIDKFSIIAIKNKTIIATFFLHLHHHHDGYKD